MGIKRLHEIPPIKRKFVSEINDTEELTDGIFPMNLKIIDYYQWKYYCPKAKHDMGTYHKCYFLG